MLLAPSSQLTFRFYDAHYASLVREREARRRAKMLAAAERRRERRGTLRHLLELSTLPESHLSVDEVRQLDAYVTSARDKIKFAWTPLEEADRRLAATHDAAIAAKLLRSMVLSPSGYHIPMGPPRASDPEEEIDYGWD